MNFNHKYTEKKNFSILDDISNYSSVGSKYIDELKKKENELMKEIDLLHNYAKKNNKLHLVKSKKKYLVLLSDTDILNEKKLQGSLSPYCFCCRWNIESNSYLHYFTKQNLLIWHIENAMTKAFEKIKEDYENIDEDYYISMNSQNL